MGLFVITMEVVCGIQWPLVSPQDFSTAKSGKKKTSKGDGLLFSK